MEIMEPVLDWISNMRPIDFVTRINKYARWTNYSNFDNKVCKLVDEKVVSILDPEYFGIHSSRLCINDFKKICIQMIRRDLTWANNEEKEYVLKLFGSY